MFDLDNLTWTCHICHESRPDRFISVYKRELYFDGKPFGFEHIRYCNDKPACITAAPRYSHMRRAETYLDNKSTRPLYERVIDAAIRVEALKKSHPVLSLVVVICVLTALCLLSWIL